MSVNQVANNPRQRRAKKKLIVIFLFLSKWSGLFFLSKYLTKDYLRILGYHSFSMGIEHQWKPQVFITPHIFEKRMEYLKKQGYMVVNLSSATEKLTNNKLSPNSVAITIDDGWYATKLIGHEILSRYTYPYTIYVTSYYSKKETPIFEMIVKYIFWKTKVKRIRTEKLVRHGIPLDANRTNSYSEVTEDLMERIIAHGNEKLDNNQRCKLSKRLGDVLGVDVLKIEESRMLSLLNEKELKTLSIYGVDIQLHSHRHMWPIDKKAALRELNQNKLFLQPLVLNRLEHFCYPNGDWQCKQIQYLKSANIKSATTCSSGLNYPNTSMYKLKRFIDGEDVPQIYFESFITGYTEILEKILTLISRTVLKDYVGFPRDSQLT